MNVQIIGYTRKFELSELEQPLYFFKDKLISMAESAELIVYICDGLYRTCDVLAQSYIADGVYNIEIDSRLSKTRTIKCLAHEIVHIKQYVNGELIIDNENEKVYWKGEEYKWDIFDDDESYLLSPWEIDANGIEYALYNLWQKTI